MRKLLFQMWWKYLGFVILLYVFVAGFLVPLRPGILDVQPFQLKSGSKVEVKIAAYNSHFDVPNKKIAAYIKIDSVHLLMAENTEVLDRKNIKATFAIPGVLPNNETLSSGTLIVADEAEGYMVMPAAFALYSDTLAIAQGGTWSHKMDQMTTDWTFSFPFRGILYETIRNTFFHVAIWFAMFILLIIGLIYSIKYLRSSHLDDDAVASSFTHVAVFFGLIGIATGSVWAKNTWGAYWTNDPKLNMSAVALMIYLAYSILRSSISGDDRRARVAAAYNIFAFVAMIPLIFIIPRLTSSLHPGNGGNPALGGEDLDNTLRMVFYPAIIGLTLLGAWISSVLYRIKRIQLALIERSLNN